MGLFSELRRRNVYRVATAYIVVGWLIMQVVDVMQPALRLPDWVPSLFAVMLLIGFPIAIVLTWIYDVTPDGVVRTDSVERSDTQRAAAARRLDALIVAGLIAVGGLVVWQQLERRGPAADVTVSSDTIAVLPFEDLSPGGDQRYFADGVSESILNALARRSSLRVTGRTSSFSFRNSDRTLQDIGKTLGVASLLEGSVRKQGDALRIVASLVSAEDGAMIWTETYESRLDDVFAVQDRIAAQVIDALRSQLDPSRTATGEPTTVDVYDQYLKAREMIAKREPQSVADAQALLLRAVAADPGYAAPLAQLALSERLLALAPGGLGRKPMADAIPRAIDYAERALALDPNEADALAIRGLVYIDEVNLPLAEASLRRALEINPAHSNARLWLALALIGELRFRDAAEQQQRLFELDPLFLPAGVNLITSLGNIGDIDGMRRTLAQLRRIEAPEQILNVTTAVFEARTGEIAEAIRRLDAAWTDTGSTQFGGPAALLRLRIGDTDSALAYRMPFGQTRSALLDGDGAAGVAVAAAMLAENDDLYVLQIEYLRTLADAGEDATLLDYYRDQFGDAEQFERELVWVFDPELPPFWTVAYAMHRSGDTDGLDRIMARWRQALDTGRANGADNFEFDYSDAQWYALSGDLETAVDYLQRAASHADGLLDVRTRYDYLNDLLAGHPGYRQLMEINERRINEERRALGLEAIVL